jgi:hypothetical protein
LEITKAYFWVCLGGHFHRGLTNGEISTMNVGSTIS